MFQKYSSGVKVLKDASLSDEIIAERISSLILDYPDGLSPDAYAMKSSLSRHTGGDTVEPPPGAALLQPGEKY